MDLHHTQIGILNRLLFQTQCRYSDLKIDPEIENNTFQFHLNQVVEKGLVTKDNSGRYSLTTEGKKVANHIDTEQNQMIGVRKISVHLYCIREQNDGLQTLIYTRLKHPFYGKQGFPAGKVRPGEKFVDAAQRELKEETNLKGNPVLFNIVHYLVKDATSRELLDDKLFLDFFIKNPTNELKGNQEGEFAWAPVATIAEHILNPFNDIETYQTALQRIQDFAGVVTFEEFEHFTNDF